MIDRDVRAPRRSLAFLVAALLVASLLPGAAQAAQRKLEEILVAPATVSLIPGAVQAYTATGVYSDATTEDLTAVVAWKSRETDVVTIDASGVATAVESGRSEITATLASARITSRRAGKIEVAELDALSIEPVSGDVRVGGQLALKAIGTYDDGTTGIDLTAQVQWSSQKTTVVRIETNAEGQIVAAGVSPGQTNVVARDLESGVKSSSATGKITVVGNLLSIDVSPDSRIARVGERVRFNATGTFEKGVVIEISEGVDWATGDPAVATIDAEGRATGIVIGSTSVSATDPTSGVSSTQSAADGRLDVVGDMTSLQVKPSPVSMGLGTKTKMKASALFTGVAKPVNVTTKVEWSSSDPTVVSVNHLGVASCLAIGSVTLAARDPLTGLTSTATGGDALVRCGVAIAGVRIVPEKLIVRVGKTKKVKAYLVYVDSSRDEITKRVTWTSSNLLVATVDREEPNIGRVHAQTPGQATITVDDPLSGLSSNAPGGASLIVNVP